MPFGSDASVKRETASADNRFHHFACHVRQAVVAATVAIGELLVVEAEQMQEGGMKIVDADFIHCGLVADLIAGAVMSARLDPSTREPNRVRVRVMVASGFVP